MVLNTGQRPILLDTWFVIWKDMSASFSSSCLRGTLPIRLQDHERANLLVDISSHPIEQLADLGVVDAERRPWHANANELKQFIHVYDPPKIDPPTNESTNPKPAPPAQHKKIKRNGNKNKAINANGNKGNIAVGDIHTGIESEAALTTIVEISTKLGRSEKENGEQDLSQRIQ